MSRATPLDQSLAAASDFEERADQITEDILRDGTVTADYFDRVHDALTSQGLVLIQGPRGCGKTHMMRYTWLQCRDDEALPLAIYVSFNRYLRLEPLLHTRADALPLFQAWVLSRIILEADDLAEQLAANDVFDVCGFLGLDQTAVETLVDRLERQIDRTPEDEQVIRTLSIESVVSAITGMCSFYGRKRAVILLDDAALTLTPEYLIEFFDIVRVLKRSNISPKASVYPGSTEYGPRFHANHEGRTLSVWLPVDHPSYHTIMRDIATRRYTKAQEVPTDVNDLLIFAAFGVPRAYLTMLRQWNLEEYASSQQAVNAIIQEHSRVRLEEYQSLRLKVPRLATLVETGADMFLRAVESLRAANEQEREEKQLILGLETSGLTPLVNRMINLLIEAGLLFEYKAQVSHGGTDRTYRRFTPHLAAMIQSRAFNERSRGSSARQSVEFLNRPSAKHPVRRKIDTLLDPEVVASLRFDLPACQKCGTARLNEDQRFCHNCGTKLVSQSIFKACMSLSITVVPQLTSWQCERLVEENILTIGDLLIFQDPGTELRKIRQVGPKRARTIMAAVENYVDEFLS